MNAPEKPQGRELPPWIARWGHAIVGAGPILAAIHAVHRGYLLGLHDTRQEAVTVDAEPRYFWFLVCCHVAAGLLLIVAGEIHWRRNS